jgi:hypothetical protein
LAGEISPPRERRRGSCEKELPTITRMRKKMGKVSSWRKKFRENASFNNPIFHKNNNQKSIYDLI